MLPALRLFVLACLAFGFQAGIFSSAATAHTLPRCVEMAVTIADAGEAEPLAADTPMPSCKSMTQTQVNVLAGPTQSSVSAVRPGTEIVAGSATLAGIDEPPKAALFSA